MKSVVAVVLAAFASCSGGGRAGAEVAPTPDVEPATSGLLNRITFYGGYGPDGLYIEESRRNVMVEPFMGPLGGIGYSRIVWDRWSISAQGFFGLTPASRTFIGAIGVGYDW